MLSTYSKGQSWPKLVKVAALKDRVWIAIKVTIVVVGGGGVLSWLVSRQDRADEDA